jgi:hypothetical protein
MAVKTLYATNLYAVIPMTHRNVMVFGDRP